MSFLLVKGQGIFFALFSKFFSDDADRAIKFFLFCSLFEPVDKS